MRPFLRQTAALPWGCVAMRLPQNHIHKRRKCRLSLAVILQGVAAFFISTKIYHSSNNAVFSNIFISCRAMGFTAPHGFLFVPTRDKPRCRSPPTPFDFFALHLKIEWRNFIWQQST